MTRMAIHLTHSKLKPAEDDIVDSSGVGGNNGTIMLNEEALEQATVWERRYARFFDVINASLSINSIGEFCAWTQHELQQIFPHGMLACGIGEIAGTEARVQNIVTCNFPPEYMQLLQQAGGLTSSPIIVQWLNTRHPVLFELSAQTARSTWLENFKRFDMQNMAAHGLSDVQGKITSYFTFSRIPGQLGRLHAELLEMLVPHLHVALVRAVKNSDSEPAAKTMPSSGLTARELEILPWLGEGKTNWEIAQVLQISENTVKNHVQRILAKLKVSNRAQAVARGLAQR
jgi:transcriptional regulator EpsA